MPNRLASLFQDKESSLSGKKESSPHGKGEELFRLDVARQLALTARYEALSADKPVSFALTLGGERRVFRMWGNGRMDILDAGGWRLWQERD